MHRVWTSITGSDEGVVQPIRGLISMQEFCRLSTQLKSFNIPKNNCGLPSSHCSAAEWLNEGEKAFRLQQVLTIPLNYLSTVVNSRTNCQEKLP
jgi:hypothetical protein